MLRKLGRFSVLLVVFTLFFFATESKKRAEAIPSSDSVIQQLGGPAAPDCPITADEILKKYNKTKAYEATFLPFGEGGKLVFQGTAHHFVDLKKTDVEAALSRARSRTKMENKDLKEVKEEVAKYEAGAEAITITDIKNMLLDAVSVAGNGALSDELWVAGAISSLGADGTTMVRDGSDIVDRMISGADALVSVISVVANIFSAAEIAPVVIEVSGYANAALFIISTSYTTARKYSEYKENWKIFEDYIIARRKLTDFNKELTYELTPLLKKADGWDIQFNDSAEIKGKIYGYFEVPIEMNLEARFTKNYKSELDPFVGTANKDGWVGRYELTMKGNLSNFPDSWKLTTFDVSGITAKNTRIPLNISNRFAVTEDFYYNANKSDQTLPLYLTEDGTKSTQMVFDGTLASGSFEFQQGGKAEGDYRGKRNGDSVDCQPQLMIDNSGIRIPYSVFVKSGKTTALSDSGVNHEEEGELFSMKESFEHYPARMIVDLSKIIGESK